MSWLASAALTVLVVLLSTVPGAAQPGDSVFVWAVAATPTMIQKVMHVVVYACLYLGWAISFRAGRRLPVAAAIAAALIGFGAILEYIQLSVPGRFGTLMDIGFNATGVFLGVVALQLLVSRQQGKTETP